LSHPTADHPDSKRRPALGEALLALGAVAFGVGVVWQTTLIRVTPAYAKVGPRAIPYLIGAGLVLIGFWLLAEALRGRRPAAPGSDSEDADSALPTDWRTVGLMALALLVYLLLIEPAGFILASTLLFVGAAFAMGSRRPARDVPIGLVLATVLFLGFTRGLGLDLPAGVLGAVLS
jgi:putative tricarboxylic transport membrane protein